MFEVLSFLQSFGKRRMMMMMRESQIKISCVVLLKVNFKHQLQLSPTLKWCFN